jgi:outer membrane protein assembly factor BamB
MATRWLPALVGLLLVLGITPASSLQPELGRKIWAARYDGPAAGDDSANAILTSADGALVYVTGQSVSRHTDEDIATAAYQADTGHRIWARRYNGRFDTLDWGSDLATSPDGAILYVAGSADYNYAILAYDARTGSRLWVARYADPEGGDDLGEEVAVSPDGALVFVTGNEYVTGRTGRHVTIALNADTGTRRWLAAFKGTEPDSENTASLAVSPDGSTVFVTGGSGDDYGTVAYEAITGARRWKTSYDGPAHGSDHASSLALSPDGTSVFVTGGSAGFSGEDFATVAYDAASGSQRWASRYNGPFHGTDNAYDLTVSPDGSRLYVTGDSFGGEGGGDIVTVAYRAASGAQRWASRYEGSGGDFDEANRIVANADGSAVYALGYAVTSDRSADYAMIGYDPESGVLLTVALIGGAGNDYGEGIAVAPDSSRIYVTGQLSSQSGFDYGTICFRSTG